LIRLIYTLFVHTYAQVIRVAGMFYPKAKAWYDGRKNLTSIVSSAPKNAFWFHCASLGEFDQGLPLMNALKEKYPNTAVVVTFFSPSGKEHYQKRKNHPVDFSCYLPIDSKSNVRAFVNELSPKSCFIIKYEFWPNLLVVLHEKKVPIYSVATLLRPNQIYFQWYGSWFRKHLNLVNHFFVQNSETEQLLKAIGIVNISVVGDLRFDTVVQRKNQISPHNDIIEAFLQGQKAIIFGSSWREEEEILLAFKPHLNGHKIILAPHNVDKKNCERLMKQFENSAARYTQFKAEDSSKPILILDTIGHLASAYAYGKLAVIGGGFRGQLHNILEPSVYGLPVLFGPKHEKFPEAKQFIEAGIGFEFKNVECFRHLLLKCENDAELKLRVIHQVEINIGATERVLFLGVMDFM
jgi:3-deoxy-D-manno-octulosonic-acid transferase